MVVNVISEASPEARQHGRLERRAQRAALGNAPSKQTPAHSTGDFAELVCSNSFGSMIETTAPGLLKLDSERMGSVILATTPGPGSRGRCLGSGSASVCPAGHRKGCPPS